MRRTCVRVRHRTLAGAVVVVAVVATAIGCGNTEGPLGAPVLLGVDIVDATGGR